MHHDVSLKLLFERSAHGLMRELTGSTVTEWLNTELPRVNLPRMDLLGKLADGRLVNIEFVSWPDDDLIDRVAVYHVETYRKYGQYPGQCILYVGRRRQRMRNTIQSSHMTYRVPVVNLADLDGEKLAASGEVGDMILGVLARVKDRRKLIRRRLERIAKLKGNEGSSRCSSCIS